MINANFSGNDLTNVPANLLQLCKLKKVKLSHNKINHFPDIPHWSASLSMVDLSDNHLSSLPMIIGAPGLVSLNLAKNQFNTVPLCICTFTTLKFLDLSDNPNIRSLPCELGMLTKLVELNLNGLKRLKEPPKAFTSSPQQCITYLRTKLSNYDDSLQSIQLMIVGNPGSGKHTLISRLQNRQLTSHECNLRIYISEWECRPSITKKAVHFRTWTFNSLEDYKSFTHNCFLLQHSLYLLLFDMTKSESEGVHDVKIWLESITYKAPYSSVMIIGTHNATERSRQDHCNDDFLLQQAKMVASVYQHRLETIGFFQIGLKDRLEAELLDNIYSYAVNYPLLQFERGKY
jgi:GTPase SAR1 family protein